MKKINVNSLDRSIVFTFVVKLDYEFEEKESKYLNSPKTTYLANFYSTTVIKNGMSFKVTNRPTVVFIIFSKLYYVGLLNCFVLSNKQNVPRKVK